MDDIFDTLMETIEDRAFPLYDGQVQYRQQQIRMEKHMQWLEEHLDGEARAHWEKLRKAEFEIGTLEREALIRTAIAAGIRFALPG